MGGTTQTEPLWKYACVARSAAALYKIITASQTLRCPLAIDSPPPLSLSHPHPYPRPAPLSLSPPVTPFLPFLLTARGRKEKNERTRRQKKRNHALEHLTKCKNRNQDFFLIFFLALPAGDQPASTMSCVMTCSV